MPGGVKKEYSMEFKLNAQLGGSYQSTFKAAQAQLQSMQREIQALSKLQGNIAAYQKQQAAVEGTRQKLAVLQEQYDNIQREMKETGSSSADLENKLLSKKQQIEKTTAVLGNQSQKLGEMGTALRNAGVDTDNLSRESQRLGQEMKDLKKAQEDAAVSAEDFGESSVSAIDAVASALVSAGIASMIKEIGDAYMECIGVSGDFEEAMSNVEALSGAGAAEMEALSEKARELGATTKFTAKESADAMGYMAMAGWDADEMLAGMDSVMRLAAASGEDLGRVSDIVTDNLTAFGLKASDTARFADVLAATATNSNTSVSIMGETFKQSAPLAGALGYSIEDVATAVGLMANAGVKGSIAGTSLKNIFNGLLEGVTLTGEAFGEFEFSAINTDGTMKDFGETIDELRGYFQQMTEAEKMNNAENLAGMRGYAGLLSILNATDEDFQSLTDSINNSAGAAQRMANIKLDNMNGQLVIMQSAWDALKMTVGDEFNPAMRRTYEILTDVINSANGFIKQHPIMLKMVTAFVGAVGAATAALTAYAAISKVIKALDMASTFAVAGPFMLGIGAVSTLTAGIVALNKAANAGIPSVEELTEAAREMHETLDGAGKTYDDTAEGILAASNMADMYITRLEEMGDYSKLNNDQQQEYRNILTLLTETVPELSDLIDIQNGTIQGGTAALRANTEAWAENARAQAYQEQLTEVYKAQAGVLLEAEKNRVRLTEANLEAQQAEEKFAAAQARMAEIRAKAQKMADEANKNRGNLKDLTYRDFLYTQYLGEEAAEYNNLAESLTEYANAEYKAREKADQYRQAIAEDEEAVSKAQGVIDETAAAIENLTGATEDNTAAVEENARQQAEAREVVDGYKERIESLCKAYDDAYKAAYDSVTGQYALWDDVDDVEEVLAGSLNKSLEKQAGYWKDYNDNLKSLTERSGDIEGLSVLLATFADGSPESVNAVAGMALATDKELREMVANWQSLKTEQAGVIASIAELQTGYSEGLDGIVAEFQSAVEGMDLNAEAKLAAMDTMRGYLEGIDALSPEVIAALEGFKSDVEAAMGSYEYQAAADAWNAAHGNNRGYSGYASGTGNAARGIHLVGENGPELAVFRGGETVLNAEDTRAVLTGERGGAVYEISFAPEYNISGAVDAEELRRILEEHDEELLDRVSELFDEAEADAVRRAYR